MTAYVPAVFLLNVVTSQCVRMKMSPSRAFLISPNLCDGGEVCKITMTH